MRLSGFARSECFLSIGNLLSSFSLLIIICLCFEYSFEINELSLKANIGENYMSSLSDKRHCFVESHLVLSHEIGNDTGGRSRYTSKAMHKYSPS